MEALQAEVDAAVKKAHDAVDLIRKPYTDAKATLVRQIEEAKRKWQDAKVGRSHRIVVTICVLCRQPPAPTKARVHTP